jgi:type IX secretion system PorP/SprF family membrane protein
MKTLLNIIALVLISVAGIAQQNAQFGQYIFNQLIINPAYAGTKGEINFQGIYSSQWTGLEGSPTTQSISIEGPVSNSMGLGVHMINDQIGAQAQRSLFGSYAYKLRLGQNIRLSLGISAGASYFLLDGSKLLMQNEIDPAIPINQVNTYRFDSKVGAFLYGKKFYAGFSVSDLTANTLSSQDLLVTGQASHYYITSGYIIKLSPSLRFKPSFMIKEDFKAPTNIDLSGFLLYNNRFWLGASVRTGARIFNTKELDNSLKNRDALLFMTEINITDNFRIGYAYTLTLSSLKDYPGHEVLLGYYISKKAKTKMFTPRYF